MAHPFITDAQATQKIQESYNDIVNSIGTGFQGTIKIADTPTEKGVYIPTEAGTYTNAGDLVYDPEDEDKGYLVQFINNGSEWVKSVVDAGESLTEVKVSKNLFDESNKITDRYINNDGKITGAAGFEMSNKIPVIPGEEYTISGEFGRTGFAFFENEEDTLGFDHQGTGGYIIPFTFTTPVNGNFIVLNLKSGTGGYNNVQLEKGDSFTGYEEYFKNKLIKKEFIPKPISQINITDLDSPVNSKAVSNYAIDRENYTSIESGVNKANPDEIISGYYSSNTNKFNNLSTWRSVWMPVKEGQNYYVSGNQIDGVGFFLEKTSVTQTDAISGTKDNPFTVPAGANFALVNITNLNNDDYNSTININLGTSAKPYEEYSARTVLNPDKIIFPDTPDNVNSNLRLLIPKQLYSVEGEEISIYFDSLYTPELGEHRGNFFINVVGNLGRHYERFMRALPTSSNVGTLFPTNFDFYRKNIKVSTGTTNINVIAKSNGSGTKKVLILGASKSTHLAPFIANYFDSDSMSVDFVGTQGDSGLKHEARGGWGLEKYNSDGGEFFAFNMVDELNPPQPGDVYSNNSSEFTISEINLSDGTGYVSGERTYGTNNPILTNSSLIKVSGNGGASVSYTDAEVNSNNPFWNSSTSFFDFSKYMSDTSQSMSAGDWVMIELGTNDCVGLPPSYPDTKFDQMYGWLMNIINSIHSYNSDIKIGVVTIPTPAESQDAFGASYGNKYPREFFIQKGWTTWNKRVLSEFDEQSVSNVYVVNSHLSLDFKYNYPNIEAPINQGNLEKIKMQSNALHPNDEGYRQMIQPYVSIIKFFG